MCVEIIAEIGQAHEGSLGILHSYIDALSKTGVDTIKFQTHIAQAESSDLEPFRVKFSYADASRYDYWKRMEFSLEHWQGIKKHCDDIGLNFLSSPFSNYAVDVLENLGVDRYKIGSGEVSNLLMLEKIAKTGKDIIVSSGMSSLDELDETINHLKIFTNKYSIMQCTSKYPTAPEDLGLNVIQELKQRYGVAVGFSDHSGEIYPSIGAVAKGAQIIEFHAVFSKEMFGPDSYSSLTMAQAKELVNGVRYISKSLESDVDKNNNAQFKTIKSIFEKSLSLNKDLKQGHIISFDDLEAKKPAGQGISARDYKLILGKQLTRDAKKWDFLTGDMLNEYT